MEVVRSSETSLCLSVYKVLRRRRQPSVRSEFILILFSFWRLFNGEGSKYDSYRITHGLSRLETRALNDLKKVPAVSKYLAISDFSTTEITRYHWNKESRIFEIKPAWKWLTTEVVHCLDVPFLWHRPRRELKACLHFTPSLRIHSAYWLLGCFSLWLYTVKKVGKTSRQGFERGWWLHPGILLEMMKKPMKKPK
jgi:hypothetical protein